MSGKRQHFIPMFLQEGFAETTENGRFVWVYRKGIEPFRANLTNVGVEGSFYTTSEDRAADDLITVAEPALAALVHDLRRRTPGPVSDPRIADLVAHLEVRTRHLRQNFLMAGHFALSKIVDFIGDDEAFSSFLLRKFREDPSMLREALAKELPKYSLPNEILPRIEQLVTLMLPALIEAERPLFRKLSAGLRPGLMKLVTDAAKSGHIQGLKGSVVPEARAKRYDRFSFGVAAFETGGLILGDSAVLFSIDGDRPHKTLTDPSDVLNAIYLPLSPQRMLIGALDPFTVPTGHLRAQIAQCSMEYFIASENTPANRELHGSIGEGSALLTVPEMERLVSQVLGE